jgi:predicted Zn-ribbon and HTH transcriptional regulator
MCERCRAGQMVEYEKSLGRGGKATVIRGLRCDRCGFVVLSDDDAIWSAVGPS